MSWNELAATPEWQKSPPGRGWGGSVQVLHQANSLSLTAIVVTPTTAVQDFLGRIADWCRLGLLQPILGLYTGIAFRPAGFLLIFLLKLEITKQPSPRIYPYGLLLKYSNIFLK